MNWRTYTLKFKNLDQNNLFCIYYFEMLVGKLDSEDVELSMIEDVNCDLATENTK